MSNQIEELREQIDNLDNSIVSLLNGKFLIFIMEKQQVFK